MKPTTLRQIANWCQGSLIQGVPETAVTNVSTDSRKLDRGDLFVALAGEKFDGHEFVEKAGEKGCAAILVSSLNLQTERFGGGIIHVSDTLVALQQLALRYRRSLDDFFVIGITGSNGKTSTKDFIASVLGQAIDVNATQGNLNNHIGLPLTILKTGPEHRAGVWEMGMNHPGEIEVLAEIAGPNAGVITNVGSAHLEFMKTREAIAEEKGMLIEMVTEEGFVVMNAEDEFTPSFRSRTRAHGVTVGIGRGDLRARDIGATERGTRFVMEAEDESVAVEIGVPGRHMVINALLAAAVGRECGLTLEEVAQGLGSAHLAAGRLQRRQIEGVTFLDDSYNANPDSMRAAIRTVIELEGSGKRAAVLGFMGELGEQSREEHRKLGLVVAESGIDLLISVGMRAGDIADGAKGGNLEILKAADHKEAAAFLRQWSAAGDIVLVKGSRAAGMEAVLREFAV